MFFFISWKKKRFLAVALCLYGAAVFLTANNAWMYTSPVAKVTDVETSEAMSQKSTRQKREQYYRQELKVKLLNGSSRGKVFVISNEYSDSGVLNQKYHRGDKLLLDGTRDRPGKGIRTQKRDAYLVAVAGALILLLLLITERNGVLTLATMVFNFAVFGIGFFKFMKDGGILESCSRMALCFAIGTLVLLNGFGRKTWAAAVSALCVLAVIILLFDMAADRFGDLDYSSLEYLGSTENAADFFRAEIMFSGLGAIMDISVTISSALEEIIRKNPEVNLRRLFQSGKEIGNDIMGTMLNVLLFVFGGGLIPMFMLRMNNGESFFTIVRFHIPYEICRFLTEGIGLVLGIPVSIIISVVILRLGKRRSMQ